MAKISKNQLVECCSKGMTVKQIAQIFSISHQAIYQRLSKLGISSPSGDSIGRYYLLSTETLAFIDTLKTGKGTASDVIKKAVENLYLDNQNL